MAKYLVVINEASPKEGLAEYAAKVAEALDVELIFGHFLNEDEYQSSIQRAATTSRTTDSIDEAERKAKVKADEVASKAVGGREVSYRTAGVIGDLPGAIIDFAVQEGCNHIFTSGERRSPTGKAIFGDQAQHIILNFDGLVTLNKPD